MRMNLKVFRVKHGLSQEKMAEEMGYMRATYSAIECGKRDGRSAFWQTLQKTFDVPDDEMWELQKNE